MIIFVSFHFKNGVLLKQGLSEEPPVSDAAAEDALELDAVTLQEPAASGPRRLPSSPQEELQPGSSSSEEACPERGGAAVGHANGQEVKRSERIMKSVSLREEGRFRERRSDRGVEEKGNQENKRGDKRKAGRASKRPQRREVEQEAGQKGVGSPPVTPSTQEVVLSDNQVRRFSLLEGWSS